MPTFFALQLQVEYTGNSIYLIFIIYFCFADGTFQNVKIIDTAGSDEFPAMRRVNIKNGDYLVVMYAVDNRQSLDQALNLCQEIREIKGNNTCICDHFR